MIEWITIIFLTLTVIALIAVIVFRERDNNKKIEYLQEDYVRICDTLDDVEKMHIDFMLKYSNSIDEHNKALDDISNKYKKLELELEKKDLEIERLNAILNYAKNDVAVTEELVNEKALEDTMIGKPMRCTWCKYHDTNCYTVVGECRNFSKFEMREDAKEM